MSQKGDLNLVSELGVKDDILKSKNIGFDYGNGTLAASQTTLPVERLKINEAALNKKFNLTDNIAVLRLQGDVTNVQHDGSSCHLEINL